MDVTEARSQKMDARLLDEARRSVRICPDTLKVFCRDSILTTLHPSQLCLNRLSPLFGPVHHALDIADVLLFVKHGSVHHDRVKGALKCQICITGLQTVVQMYRDWYRCAMCCFSSEFDERWALKVHRPRKQLDHRG